MVSSGNGSHSVRRSGSGRKEDNDEWGEWMDEENIRRNVERMALPMVAGTLAFGVTLAVSTWTQGMILGISTGTRAPIPSLAGMISVAAASMASHHVSTSTILSQTPQQFLSKLQQQQWQAPSASSIQSKAQDIIPSVVTAASNIRRTEWDRDRVTHTVRVCLVGMLIYKGVWGGRFWSVAPSSYTTLGSFARRSLPATNDSYATSAQRQQIERLGRKYGCHTCGSRMIFATSSTGAKFHADHMPPRSVVTAQMKQRWRKFLLPFFPIKQRFYPQCLNCSNKQGKILGKATQQLRMAIANKNQTVKKISIQPQFLTKAGGGRNAHFHGFRPRLSHLTGASVAAITVSSSSTTSSTNNYYKQHYDPCAPFQNIQDTITNTAQPLLSWIQTNFK